MYAVISFAGHQYKVKEGDKFEVNYVDAEVGSTVDVEEVLAVFDEEGKNSEIGTPVVAGKKVSLKVLEHAKGDKVRVFKMKAKKRYRRNLGFRPMLTSVEVVSIK